MPTARPVTEGIEGKLDAILVHLERMDKRDKMRTIGGFIRSVISIVPLVLFLWSAWYFAAHGSELMKMIADQAASSAASYTKTQSQGMVNDIINKYSFPGQK